MVRKLQWVRKKNKKIMQFTISAYGALEGRKLAVASVRRVPLDARPVIQARIAVALSDAARRHTVQTSLGLPLQVNHVAIEHERPHATNKALLGQVGSADVERRSQNKTSHRSLGDLDLAFALAAVNDDPRLLAIPHDENGMPIVVVERIWCLDVDAEGAIPGLKQELHLPAG